MADRRFTTTLGAGLNEIAARDLLRQIGPAGRAALLWLPEDGSSIRRRAYSKKNPSHEAMLRLEAFRLAEVQRPSVPAIWRATERGMVLRRFLLQQEAQAA
jgi:hypothetical protein